MSDQSPEHSDEQNYGFFMTALMGLEDDAALSGHSEEGLLHLRLAIDAFEAEARKRFPDFMAGD